MQRRLILGQLHISRLHLRRHLIQTRKKPNGNRILSLKRKKQTNKQKLNYCSSKQNWNAHRVDWVGEILWGVWRKKTIRLSESSKISYRVDQSWASGKWGLYIVLRSLVTNQTLTRGFSQGRCLEWPGSALRHKAQLLQFDIFFFKTNYSKYNWLIWF